MTIEEVTTCIKERRIDDIPFESIIDSSNNPTKYNLTFGDFDYLAKHILSIADRLAKAQPKKEVDQKLQVDCLNAVATVRAMEKRVRALEDKLEAIGDIFMERGRFE